jgi:hypothetical protein
MNDTTPTLAVLDHAAGPEADERPEDKRLKGERNRTEALVWLGRFGWLTSKMRGGQVWPAAAQGQTMARRTLGALADDKLVVAQIEASGRQAYRWYTPARLRCTAVAVRVLGCRFPATSCRRERRQPVEQRRSLPAHPRRTPRCCFPRPTPAGWS